MDIKATDDWMRLTGADLDFILALEEYLNLHHTSLTQFKEWKDNEDLHQMRDY